MKLSGLGTLLRVAVVLAVCNFTNVIPGQTQPRGQAQPRDQAVAQDALPVSLYPHLVAAIQNDAPAAYDVGSQKRRRYHAENPAQGFTAAFDDTDFQIVAGDKSWRLGMRLTGYGYGSHIHPAPVSGRIVEKNRVEYRHGAALTEWYVNGPLGLEQGFTLATPPAGDGPGDDPGDGERRGGLVLALALTGGLEPVLGASGQAIRFRTPQGGVALRYGGLYAYDAKGRKLPSRMAVAEGSVEIHVDDSAAAYPITIDPLLTNETKITTSDAAAGDFFGGSVDISGDTVVVGARTKNNAGKTDDGSAYVFVRTGTGWTQQAKLTASDAATGDIFGTSVAISGNAVVVGARGDNLGTGSAYVFARSGGTWSQQAKLTASDAAVEDFFGWSVDISGDTVVVGARGDDDAGDFSGSAYVFVRPTGVWFEIQKLTASDAAAFDFFGESVAIDGDTVVVGATGDDDVATESGSAYVFVRPSGLSWFQQQKLTASDAAHLDVFGISVAISGDTVAVGAPGKNLGTGSAYVFLRSGGEFFGTWSQQKKLTASDRTFNDSFGRVAISGDTVAVGAPGDDQSGSAYVFVRSGGIWSQEQKLTASDRAFNDRFGVSVAISGDRVVAGAHQDGDAGDFSGAAYVYESASGARPASMPWLMLLE